MATNKKYGLILPEKGKKQQPIFQAARNVFGNDSDSEDDLHRRPTLRPSDNINRQSKVIKEKAILEDPTVYQYDEIYDSMTSKKETQKENTNESKKPKYIENLIKASNKRKIENERRLERQIQKEREKEGDEFADKEVFVTTAYKKKLEEMRKEEEKEKYEEYLESIGDVTRQQDLGGFYRHLYEQKLGVDNPADNSKENAVQIKHSISEKESSSVQNSREINDTDTVQTIKKRNYRKRKASVENAKFLSEGEIEDSDEEINRCNLEDIRMSKRAKKNENIDADSDFSIDGSSDEEINLPHPTTKKPEDNSKDNKQTQQNILISDEKDSENHSILIIPEVKKVDIWKKRTVGDVLHQALKRYYERKAARGF